jgi:bacterioferritin-associated ferredoxin
MGDEKTLRELCQAVVDSPANTLAPVLALEEALNVEMMVHDDAARAILAALDAERAAALSDAATLAEQQADLAARDGCYSQAATCRRVARQIRAADALRVETNDGQGREG